MDTKEFKQLLKTIKFPSGKDTRIMYGASYAEWDKVRGHSGMGVLARVREAAYAAGFEQCSGNSASSADGSRVGHGSVYTKGDITLRLYSHYGQTSHDNRFSISIEVKDPE